MPSPLRRSRLTAGHRDSSSHRFLNSRATRADMQFLERRVLMSADLITASTSTLWGTNGDRFEPSGPLTDWSYAGYHSGEEAPPSSFAQSRNVKDYGAKGDGKSD